MNSSIIISVRPEFAQKILTGEKKWEYRRKWAIHPSRKVYIYETAPTSKIVGVAFFSGVITGSPSDVWEMTGEDGGIDHSRYLEYFKDRETAYALRIFGVVRFSSLIDPRLYSPGWRPPQSHAYFDFATLMKGGKA